MGCESNCDESLIILITAIKARLILLIKSFRLTIKVVELWISYPKSANSIKYDVVFLKNILVTSSQNMIEGGN